MAIIEIIAVCLVMFKIFENTKNPLSKSTIEKMRINILLKLSIIYYQTILLKILFLLFQCNGLQNVIRYIFFE